MATPTLSELSAMLQDTTRMIALTERAAAEAPESPSIASSMVSLIKRQADLTRWFAEETARAGVTRDDNH